MEENFFSASASTTALQQAVQKIKEEASKVLIGQDKMIDLIIASILANGHILIEGVPGVAKTLTAKLISKSLDVDFSRIQFTPDLMPSDVIGTTIFNTKTNEFEFKHGPVFSNIVLIDEINRAPAKTQAALFEAMEERQVTVDGHAYKLEAPFIVLATQNPVEQEGTYRLPEAQLDRFLFKIEVTYPSLDEEIEILKGAHTRQVKDPIALISSILTAADIATHKESVKSIRVEFNLLSYIAKLIDGTRNNSSLFLGASPRASIAILNGAKAFAAMNGRDFVTPEDIKEVIYPVLIHRIILTPEKEMEGITAREVIKDLIEKIEVPR